MAQTVGSAAEQSTRSAPGKAKCAHSIFARAMHDEPIALDVTAGEVMVYSRRSPAKESDNEDAAAVIETPDGAVILAVADGVGGLPGGAQASELALRTLCDAFDAADPLAESRTTILNALEAANEAVMGMNIGAGATIVVTEVARGAMRPYHAGDSMVLLIGQRGKVRHVTLPHSPVGYAVEAGVIDAEAAMHHEDRHLVSNLLGTGEMWIELGSMQPMQQRDTLLLASDGLFDNLHLQEIGEIIRCGPLKRAARDLAGAAHARMLVREQGQPSKPDDLTFVLYRAKGRRG